MRLSLLAVALVAASCVPLAQGVAGERQALAGEAAVARVTFELPYDLSVSRDGSIFFPDRARILTLQPSTGRVRVYRRVPGAGELVGPARLENGTVFASDLPSGRLLRIPRTGPVETVATVPMPVDLLVDPSGSNLWVASIAEGVGRPGRRCVGPSGAVRLGPAAARARPNGRRRLRRARRPRCQPGRREDGRGDAARACRRVQGRRGRERRRLWSDPAARGRPRRPHLAERSRRARRRYRPAPARTVTERLSVRRCCRAPLRSAVTVAIRRADRAGPGDQARRPLGRDDRHTGPRPLTSGPRPPACAGPDVRSSGAGRPSPA